MPNGDSTTRRWRIGGDRHLDLDRPQIMGIVNATPDSFSDGGLYASTEALVGHALRHAEQGASIIDIGGESTRPGAERVECTEQIARTAPVIEQIKKFSDALISIDTTRAAVAEAALDMGAEIINDVSAGFEDPDLLPLVARRQCGLVLMHRRLPPDEDSYSDQYDQAPEYENVVETVRSFLVSRCEAALEAGVRPEMIVIDPGFGFGKTVEQNFALAAGIGSFLDTGYEVMCAGSRKSFIGAVTGVSEPKDRLAGSIAFAVSQQLAGVRIFRVHDVQPHREALSGTHALLRASKGCRPTGTPVG